jgi:hypothetical protein
MNKETGSPSKPSAVFIHAFWRTGSTWLWGRFRALAETHCYYEPFHPDLATLDDANIEEYRADNWQSGHPLGAPYFVEYSGLLSDDGGVSHFEPAMATERFFPRGKLASREQEYLAALKYHAEAGGRLPIYGFCRSLGRSGAIRSALGGCHVMLLREPFSVLNSVIASGLAIDYLEILSHPGNLCVLSQWDFPLNHYRVPVADRSDVAEWAIGHPHSAASAIFHLYLLCCFIGLLYCDDIIQIEQVAESDQYRNVTQARLRDLTGLEVDLSDCSSPNRFDAIQPYHLALDSLTDSLDAALFARSEELAELIARTQGIEPVNDPLAQMSLLVDLFQKSRARLAEDRVSRGVPLALTDFDALQYFEAALVPAMREHEELTRDRARLAKIERTLSWRLTRPLRHPMLGRLRGWFRAGE